jgi:hypothetical protein
MGMSVEQNRGIVDATNRILKVLLKRPAFKENVRSLLNGVDPDNARELARTILWEDPEIVLSLMGALPSLANSMIRFLDEIILQVREKFPPELLHAFLEEIMEEFDGESIRSIRDNISTMVHEGYFHYDPGSGKKGEGDD